MKIPKPINKSKNSLTLHTSTNPTKRPMKPNSINFNRISSNEFLIANLKLPLNHQKIISNCGKKRTPALLTQQFSTNPTAVHFKTLNISKNPARKVTKLALVSARGEPVHTPPKCVRSTKVVSVHPKGISIGVRRGPVPREQKVPPAHSSPFRIPGRNHFLLPTFLQIPQVSTSRRDRSLPESRQLLPAAMFRYKLHEEGHGTVRGISA